MVIASKITLRRNFKEFQFPSTLSYEDSTLIASEVKKIFKSNKTFSTESFNDTFSIQKLYTYQALNFVSDEFVSNDLEKLLVRKDGFNTTIMVNEDDHIRIDSISFDDKILLLYDDVNKIADKIDKKFPFAFDDRYGYLTSNLAYVGTGMIPSFILHIPMLELSNQMPKVKEACNKFGFDIKPAFTDEEKSSGGFYEVYTRLTLGMAEKEILSNLKLMILKMCDKEKSLRQEILKKEKIRLTDEVNRAYGIIKNAKLISLKEAEVLISYIKLGLDMNLYDKEITDELTGLNVYKVFKENDDKLLFINCDSNEKIKVDAARAKCLQEFIFEFRKQDDDDIDLSDIF